MRVPVYDSHEEIKVATPALMRLDAVAAPGEALARVGDATSAIALDLKRRRDEALARQQRLDDANFNTTTLAAFHQQTAAALDKYAHEGNPADPMFLKTFEEETETRIRDLLAARPQGPNGSTVSEEAIAQLMPRLREGALLYSRQAVQIMRGARAQETENALKVGFNEIAYQVRIDPTSGNVAFGALDLMLGDFDDALNPQSRAELRQEMRAELIVTMARSFAEKGAYDAARSIVDNDKLGSELDPRVADTLLGEIEAAELREQARTAAERRAHLATVADKIRGAADVWAAGFSPANVAELDTLTAGTELAGDWDRLKALGREAVAFALKSPAEQQAILQRLNSGDVKTPEEVQRIDWLTRVAGDVAAKIERDPLGYAHSIGQIDEPADISSLEPGALALRVQQAEVAGAHFGLPVSPLRDGEVDYLRRTLTTADPDTAVALFDRLNAGLGRKMPLVAEQLWPKEPRLALALDKSGAEPLLAREIIVGARRLQETPAAKPDTQYIAEAVAAVAGDAFRAIPQYLPMYAEAAVAVFAARRVPYGKLDFMDGGTEELQRALADVMGQPFEINGHMILPPAPGVDEDGFEDAIEAVTDQDLVRFGNERPIYGTGDPFIAEMLRDEDVIYTTVGEGRYTLELDGIGFIETTTAGPYILDLGALLRSRGQP